MAGVAATLAERVDFECLRAGRRETVFLLREMQREIVRLQAELTKARGQA